MLTFEQIKELITAVSDNKLERVELERSGFRLHIVGRSAPTLVTAPAPATAEVALPIAAQANEGSDAGSTKPETQEEKGPVEGAHLLESPIVGTFYTAASPDSDPYARVGDRVTKGQVLCIVEAMKLMNEIESDVNGVVVEIFPQNAQPVEFGEALFAIKTD